MDIITEHLDVVIGVDTHKHEHTAAAVNSAGGVLALLKIDTTTADYDRLIEWADTHGAKRAWSIEGTGSYGAGLYRRLTDRGHRFARCCACEVLRV